MFKKPRPSFSLVCLEGIPIFEQLQLEEALLRSGKENICLINTKAPPAIVMGISGKEEELLNLNVVKQQNIPTIRRYSGGGTVYIDPNTLFVTFIANKEIFPFSVTPKSLMQWSATLYEGVFPPSFALNENDYVLGEHKCGGNAQYIQKERVVHHTSFLYAFDPQAMQCLKLPKKRPTYRQDRPHNTFLCSLDAHFPTIQHLQKGLITHLSNYLNLTPTPLKALAPLLNLPHRKATKRVL